MIENCKGTHRDRQCSDAGEAGLTNEMLLVRSGIETNPGPTSPADSSCCNAFQHFKRVKNQMKKAQESFQSKVTQDTLTKKVIEIEETGISEHLLASTNS